MAMKGFRENARTCASYICRKKVLYELLKSEMLPVLPLQLPTADSPSYEPSYREPTPRPFKYLAQSVIAGVHSPTMAQSCEFARVAPFEHALLIWSWFDRAFSASEKTW